MSRIAVVDGFCTIIDDSRSNPTLVFDNGHDYVIGFDPATGQDFSAVVIIGKEDNMKMQEFLPPDVADAIAGVVYDVLVVEGILKPYTLEDAVAEAVDAYNEQAAKGKLSSDNQAILHGVILDFVEFICPAVRECFDEVTSSTD